MGCLSSHAASIPPTNQPPNQPETPPLPYLNQVEGASIPEHHHHQTTTGGDADAEAGGFVVGEVTDHAIDLHDIRPGEVREGGAWIGWLIMDEWVNMDIDDGRRFASTIIKQTR